MLLLLLLLLLLLCNKLIAKGATGQPRTLFSTT
jgi:hypothetical protein